MFNIEEPKTSDTFVRLNAMELVLRAMLANLTPEQLAKTRHDAKLGVELMLKDPSFTARNCETAKYVGDMVRFLFAHIPE